MHDIVVELLTCPYCAQHRNTCRTNNKATCVPVMNQIERMSKRWHLISMLGPENLPANLQLAGKQQSLSSPEMAAEDLQHACA